MIYKLILVLSLVMTLNAAAGEFKVFKTPNCGCCQKWVQAIEAQGHTVDIHHLDDLTKIKADAGVPRELSACHTALVDGYVIEGHVPITAINELLEEKPDLKGIAVPGMPAESLGMEVGREPHAYVVYGFKNDHSVEPFSEYIGIKKIK